MAIAQDASTPVVATQTGNATTTLNTVSFTPPNNSLIVAMAGVVYSGSGTAGAPFTLSDSLSGTWSKDAAIQSANATIAGVFTRFVTTGGSAMTCTLTTDAATKGKQLSVVVLTGTATSAWQGATKTFASATATGLAQSVTTTTAGSWVMLATAYDTTGTIVVNGSTTQYNQLADATDGARIQSGRATAATVTPGAVTLGWTGDSATTQKTYGALEILPAGGATVTVAKDFATTNRARFRASLW